MAAPSITADTEGIASAPRWVSRSPSHWVRGPAWNGFWILATGLASQTSSGEPAPRPGAIRGLFHKLNIRPWAVLLFLMVLSVVLLPLFELEANRQPGTYYGDWIFGTIATQLRTTGFVHYLLDRSVYRMSDPQVRRAASGLLDPAGKT